MAVKCVRTVNETARNCALKHGAACEACDNTNCTYCKNPYQYDPSTKTCYEPTDLFATLSVTKNDVTKRITMTKYNVGDFPQLSVERLRALGIKVMDVGMGADVNFPVCWKATATMNTNYTCTSNTNYSGCKRTTCNALAGQIACGSMGWRMATTREMQYFLSNGAIENDYPQNFGSSADIDERAKMLKMCNASIGESYVDGYETCTQEGTPLHCYNPLTNYTACIGPAHIITSDMSKQSTSVLTGQGASLAGIQSGCCVEPAHKGFIGSVRCVVEGGL